MKKFLKIKNKCGMDLSQTEELFHDLCGFAQKRFAFKKPPTLHLISDGDNASKPLGKTAYYDPQGMAITIYTDNRHTKDILRSLAHELVHHTQNENGMLNDSGYHGQGYAQKNKDLRQSEKEAYLKGNMCFRDWEDSLKQSKPTIYNEWRINTMSTKKWKNNELMENLSEKFGFKMDLDQLKEGMPAGLKKYHDEQAAKKKGKDSDEDEESEEEDSEENEKSSKGGKMPMKDEPAGKDLNKDGKKGHGKVPAFLKEKEHKNSKGMNETKLRKVIRKMILSEMKKKIIENKNVDMSFVDSLLSNVSPGSLMKEGEMEQMSFDFDEEEAKEKAKDIAKKTLNSPEADKVIKATEGEDISTPEKLKMVLSDIFVSQKFAGGYGLAFYMLGLLGGLASDDPNFAVDQFGQAVDIVSKSHESGLEIGTAIYAVITIVALMGIFGMLAKGTYDKKIEEQKLKKLFHKFIISEIKGK